MTLIGQLRYIHDKSQSIFVRTAEQSLKYNTLNDLPGECV